MKYLGIVLSVVQEATAAAVAKNFVPPPPPSLATSEKAPQAG